MEESEKAKGKIVGKFSQTSKKLKYRQLQIAAESKILFGVKKNIQKQWERYERQYTEAVFT